MTREKENKKTATRSKCLLIAGLIGAIYSIYLICYFGGSLTEGSTSDQIGGFIATAMVTPHMVLVVAGSVFLLVGYFARMTWAALVGSISMCVGAVVFIMYGMFCIPSIVLGFVGYSKQKKLNANQDHADGNNQSKEDSI